MIAFLQNIRACLRTDPSMLAPYLRTRLGLSPFRGWRLRPLDRGRLNFMAGEILCQGHYRFATSSDRPLILDCGSNIGLSVQYFRRRHPQARIVAFEPDPATFARLQENTERLRDVLLVHAALASEDGETTLYFEPGTDGALTRSTIRERGGSAQVRVPERRLSAWAREPVDFVKLDVEGAEPRVLADLVETGTIDNVRRMVVEYHHPLAGSLAAFLAAIERAGFRYQVTASGSAEEHEQPEDVLIYCSRVDGASSGDSRCRS